MSGTWKVKVTNAGSNDLIERFKGKEFILRAGETVEMDREDAVDYAKQFKPIVTDGEKNDLPDGYKKLKIDDLYKNPANDRNDDDLVCHATGERATSKEELRKLIADNAHMLIDDEAREALEKQQKEQLGILEQRIAAMEARKNPGRPKKGAQDGEKETA